MSANRRPRKAYRPKAIANPMMTATRESLALDLHLAVEAAITAPGIESFDQLARMLATMSIAINQQSEVRICDRQDDDAKAIHRMMKALERVQDRFDRVGKYGVSPAEAEELRASSWDMDKALGRIPFNVLQASIYQVSRALA
jgi:hypothetical protein